ncbi:MAG: cytochrome P450 [Pikeienuella sp.]
MTAFFARQRAEAPVFFDEGLGYWIVTRRADARKIFGDPQTFSASNVHDPVNSFPPEVVQFLKDNNFSREKTQANCDQPKHTRIRKAAQGFLNMRQFKKREAQIEQMVEEAADALKGRGRVDLMGDFAYELPARVLFLLLGVPEVNARRIKVWADSGFMMISGNGTPEQVMEAAVQTLDLWTFCGDLIKARQKEPKDDYPSHLLALHAEDPDSITLNEIHNLTYGVLLAGHETTTNSIGTTLHMLLDQRDQWARLVADPELIKNAVEEGLRAGPPVINWRRRTTKPVTVGGVDLPEGAPLMISLCSINRDEDYFGPAETLDVARDNAGDHTSFGYGIHFCLGANLARMEIAMALRALTKRFPNMTLVPDTDPKWQPTLLVRGPAQVLVDLNEG